MSEQYLVVWSVKRCSPPYNIDSLWMSRESAEKRIKGLKKISDNRYEAVTELVKP